MLPRRISFDYESLDADRRVVLEGRACRIKERVRRTRQDLIGIGEELIGAKAELGHGQFGAWLEAEFTWNDHFARELMNVARVFKTDFKSDLDLTPTAMRALAAPFVPEAARQEALDQAANGQHVGTKEAREIIDRHREDRESGGRERSSHGHDPRMIIDRHREFREYSPERDLPGQGQLFDEEGTEEEEWGGRPAPPRPRPISPWKSDDLLCHVRKALDWVDDVVRAVSAKEKNGGYGGIGNSLGRLTGAERLQLRAELEDLIEYLQGWADQIEERFDEAGEEEAG